MKRCPNCNIEEPLHVCACGLTTIERLYWKATPKPIQQALLHRIQCEIHLCEGITAVLAGNLDKSIGDTHAD
jgi:hypothetical protein